MIREITERKLATGVVLGCLLVLITLLVRPARADAEDRKPAYCVGVAVMDRTHLLRTWSDGRVEVFWLESVDRWTITARKQDKPLLGQ